MSGTGHNASTVTYSGNPYLDAVLANRMWTDAIVTFSFPQNNSEFSATYPDDGGLFETFAKEGENIASYYEQGNYSRAMRAIMDLADQANPYVEENAPWELRKDPDKAQQLQDVCSVALNLFRQLAIYLAPVLPRALRPGRRAG